MDFLNDSVLFSSHVSVHSIQSAILFYRFIGGVDTILSLFSIVSTPMNMLSKFFCHLLGNPSSYLSISDFMKFQEPPQRGDKVGKIISNDSKHICYRINILGSQLSPSSISLVPAHWPCVTDTVVYPPTGSTA